MSKKKWQLHNISTMCIRNLDTLTLAWWFDFRPVLISDNEQAASEYDAGFQSGQKWPKISQIVTFTKFKSKSLIHTVVLLLEIFKRKKNFRNFVKSTSLSTWWLIFQIGTFILFLFLNFNFNFKGFRAAIPNLG